ncbi:MAG: hypothetical protein IJ610_11705 [Bacteroidaceae bacterium]|nr:hypothetical protein [Bacteroidaceae bacterium]
MTVNKYSMTMNDFPNGITTKPLVGKRKDRQRGKDPSACEVKSRTVTGQRTTRRRGNYHIGNGRASLALVGCFAQTIFSFRVRYY